WASGHGGVRAVVHRDPRARLRPWTRLEQRVPVDLASVGRADMNQIEAAAAESETIIELRDVSISFRYQPVLRQINFTVPKGETLCIIGESGCGKTVMLKLIIGLLQPTRGSVQFDGRDIASLGGRELVKMRLRFGFLFQMAALFDSLTVFDNVAFGLRE